MSTVAEPRTPVSPLPYRVEHIGARSHWSRP
jgi:hypothetical protein